MAKRKAKRRDGRDPLQQSLILELPRPTPLVVSPQTLYSESPFEPVNLAEFEDRRRYHPEGPFRAPLTLSGTKASIAIVDRPAGKKARAAGHRFINSQTKGIRTFEASDQVLICVRRKRRKEVLFAKRKAGKRGQRKPHRSWFSQISCR